MVWSIWQLWWEIKLKIWNRDIDVVNIKRVKEQNMVHFSKVQSVLKYDHCLKCKILKHSNYNQRKKLFTFLEYDRWKSNGKT